MEIEPFSPARLHANLDRLVGAFEQKGMPVSGGLLPPVPEDALRKACGWFPAELPLELVALYGWRGGRVSGARETEFPLLFRDCAFASVETARAEYANIMASYGANPTDHALLKYSFPFAEFNGGWLVFPCKGQSLDSRLKAPVVSVFQGIDVWFYSIERMVLTCLDWVSHEKYVRHSHLPQKEEMEIWRNHNPGIFQR